MGLTAKSVGRRWGPVRATADARWTMAYAAGLGETRDDYYATDAGAVPAHPLFSVSAEWSLLIDDIGASGIWLPEDRLRGVHATHDLVIHEPLMSGTTFDVTAEVVGVEARQPGAYQVVEHRGVAEDGRPLWTSWTGSLFRGVGVDGEAVLAPLPDAPAFDRAEPLKALELSVGPLDALVYTECARIWNPIHTDRAVANAAGLDEPILHGTATLAKAVGLLLEVADAHPTQVRRVRCRFGAPALLGTTLRVRVCPEQDGWWPFEVLGADERPVLREGSVELAR